MKVAIALALVAACFAASVSASASPNVDWGAVEAKITELESQICGCIQQILTIIDNEQVGIPISGELKEAYCARVKALVEQAKAAIRDHSLTEDKAKELWGQLKDILAEVQSAIQDELPKLSPYVASQIRDIFYACYASAEQKFQEIYALLRA